MAYPAQVTKLLGQETAALLGYLCQAHHLGMNDDLRRNMVDWRGAHYAQLRSHQYNVLAIWDVPQRGAKCYGSV